MTLADVPAHPLAKQWPALYRVVRECWRLTYPAIDATMERLGTPRIFYDWIELGLETVSVEEFEGRDPYGNPARYPLEYERLVADGWLRQIASGRYEVLEPARAAVRETIRAAQEALGRHDSSASPYTSTLEPLLERLALACRSAPAPRKWAIDRRFRVEEAASSLGRIFEDAMELFARRDDVHLHVWQLFESEGRRWNAFALIASGEAATAREIASRAAMRGWAAEAYESDLDALRRRGWVDEVPLGERRFVPTTTGLQLHRAVDRLTDDFFYLPWDAMTAKELAALYESAVAVGDVLADADRPDPGRVW